MGALTYRRRSYESTGHGCQPTSLSHDQGPHRSLHDTSAIWPPRGPLPARSASKECVSQPRKPVPAKAPPESTSHAGGAKDTGERALHKGAACPTPASGTATSKHRASLQCTPLPAEAPPEPKEHPAGITGADKRAPHRSSQTEAALRREDEQGCRINPNKSPSSQCSTWPSRREHGPDKHVVAGSGRRGTGFSPQMLRIEPRALPTDALIVRPRPPGGCSRQVGIAAFTRTTLPACGACPQEPELRSAATPACE